MLKKRIIPCLDILNGRTVKGINFQNLKDAGDPIELAKRYMDEGADELVFLDIGATIEERGTLYNMVEKVAKAIQIPFTVGGGVRNIEDAKRLLQVGADKISINSAAILNPMLICELSKTFGNQCVVVAIDMKCINDKWYVHRSGGKINTDILALDWARKVSDLGAGELLITAMNNDGVSEGFEMVMTPLIAESVNIPVIASGGAGNEEHFLELFSNTNINGALAASIFHFQKVSIPALKKYLKDNKIPIRI